MATNIRFSSKIPASLIEVLNQSFTETRLEFKSNKSQYKFIIPVFYNYSHATSAFLKSKLGKLPEVNLDLLSAIDTSNDFDRFMERKENEAKIIPVLIYFMPWIKLQGKVE